MTTTNEQFAALAALELFHRAYRTFTSRADGILEEQGLGRSHHRILYFVGRNPAVPVNTLLGILKVSKQALNQPLRQLLGKKLIAVEVATHDRRQRLLSLTPAGVQLEQELTATQISQLQAVSESTGDEAMAAWQKVMLAFSGPP